MLMFEMIAHAVADSAKLNGPGDDVVKRMVSGRVRVCVAERAATGAK